MKPSVVYVIGSRGRFCKIGLTTDFDARWKALRTASPLELYVVAVIPCGHHEGLWLESLFHKIFAHAHIRGEWFSLTEKEIEWIQNQELLIDADIGRDPDYRGPYADPPLSCDIDTERRLVDIAFRS